MPFTSGSSQGFIDRRQTEREGGRGYTPAAFARMAIATLVAHEQSMSVLPTGLQQSRGGESLVHPLGLEPRTYGLKVRCSTN